MGKYNGLEVTVGPDVTGKDNQTVTVTFEDGTSQVVALGAVGELTAEEKAAVWAGPPPPPPPDPPIT